MEGNNSFKSSTLWPKLLDIALKKLLINSAEKYMHRKYFSELRYSYSISKASIWLEIGES